MEILGIGMPELIFILIVALLVLGPRDMEKTGRTIGVWLNNLVRSDGWKALLNVSREMRTLPNRLMREANIEAIIEKKASSSNPDAPDAPKTPERSQPYSAAPSEHQIAPERLGQKEAENGQPDNA